MKHLKQFLAVALGLVLLNACKKDDDAINSIVGTRNLTLQLQKPDKVTNIHYGTLTLTFTELNRNDKVERIFTNLSQNELTLPLLMGSYEMRIAATATYTLNGETVAGEMSAFVSKVDVLNDSSFPVSLSIKAKGNDFIIEEIFFTGTATPEGKQYFGDQYIKLYNPTNRVLYADGLVLADSEFLTVTKRDYTPNIMAEAFTAGSMVQIPGNGTQYPVQPGASIVIAEQGINHKENNPNSIDLSKADFENFYPPRVKDVDGVGVTNNINLHGIFIFNNRGNRSYVIARFPEGTATATLQYDYEYKVATKLMQRQALKIPNNWIVDAVNLSTKTGFEWIVTSSSLDSGWAYVANDEKDASRYGKSVRRKVLSQNNGKPIFKDTNNSTEDFEILTTPTLKK
jgi:putative lipoprotein